MVIKTQLLYFCGKKSKEQDLEVFWYYNTSAALY